jgi:4-amino-4-deoxy-L-arabinose transferase-like glycosyltransferase
VLPAAKILIHLVTFAGYGYFRDEFYYIVGSNRLAFGYVDHPPFSLLVLRVFRFLFGESLFATRLPSALFGGLTVLLVGLLCRQFGGRRFAQTLAMLAAAIAPVFLSANHTYSMNAIDIALWTLTAWLLVKILNSGDQRLWLVLGRHTPGSSQRDRLGSSPGSPRSGFSCAPCPAPCCCWQR